MHDIIQRQTRHLVRMVDHLLDVSRITRGKVELRRAHVDLHAILAQVLTVLGAIARDGVSLQVPALDAPLWMDGDAQRLEQIFTNLLDNATKYTDAGGRAELSVGQERGEEGWAVVRVKDNGIGIASDMLGRVFEPFTQADNSLDRKRGGLGIGLMLVQRLVDLHGGQVTAASEGHGRGSTFTVRLPLLPERGPRRARRARRRGGPPPRASAPSASSWWRTTRTRAARLREMLEAWGHDVEVAADGLEGVTKALQREGCSWPWWTWACPAWMATRWPRGCGRSWARTSGWWRSPAMARTRPGSVRSRRASTSASPSP